MGGVDVMRLAEALRGIGARIRTEGEAGGGGTRLRLVRGVLAEPHPISWSMRSRAST
jgi:hypothetical protein